MSRRVRLHTALLVISVLVLAGCVDLGGFAWVADYQEPAPVREYVIRKGDLLRVHVFNQEGSSARVRVRPDGRITLPLLDDVSAEGTTPAVLAQQIQGRLKQFVNSPQVTVSVEESSPLGVAVIGEVTRPGVVAVEPGANLLQVLAAAGGLTEFAHNDRIFVIRSEPAPARIRFDYTDLVRGAQPASAFRLRIGDAVVVE